MLLDKCTHDEKSIAKTEITISKEKILVGWTAITETENMRLCCSIKYEQVFAFTPGSGKRLSVVSDTVTKHCWAGLKQSLLIVKDTYTFLHTMKHKHTLTMVRYLIYYTTGDYTEVTLQDLYIFL